jgi:transposase-like protein
MNKGFAILPNFVRELSPYQQELLFLTLKNIVEPKSAAKGSLIGELRKTKFKEGFVCPHCDGCRVVRYGKFNHRQRYKCKDCLRTFSDLTHTPLSKTRYSDKWITFIECMLQGHSLRKSADLVGVTWVTLFYWRHKLLKALQQIDIPSFQGIVEMDETYFLYSEKG